VVTSVRISTVCMNVPGRAVSTRAAWIMRVSSAAVHRLFPAFQDGVVAQVCVAWVRCTNVSLRVKGGVAAIR
jgi:hypothetical protein